MTDERFDLRRIDFNEIFPWFLLFRGFRLARDPKKILLGTAGALLMSLGWAFIGSFSTDKVPSPPTPPSAEATEQEKLDYHRQLETYRERELRYRYVHEVRRLPWQAPDAASAARGIYVSPMRGDAGWTNVGIDAPASLFLVVEPIIRLVLPALLTFHSSGSTAIGLVLLIWTILVWSIFGSAICRISAVQIARHGNVGLVESLRFVLTRFVSFFSSPILPFLGVVLIVVFCLIGGLLLYVPGLNVIGGLFWILPLLAGFVMVAALLGLAIGWPLMFAAISAEATESFDALSRAFSYVLGRPWNYLFYSACVLVYGGLMMVFATIFADGMVHMSKYAVSWGHGDVATLYAFAPEAPGWRTFFGPADGAAPLGFQYATAYLVGFWTHVVFLGLVGFTYSYFWSQVTAIYFLLRRDVDETEIEEVYLEEEDEEPFPTATPTVAPPKPAAPTPPPATGGPSGTSLPIIEPPN